MKIKFRDTNITISFFFAAALAFSLLLGSAEAILSAVAAAFLHESGHFAALCLIEETPKNFKITVSGIELKRESELNLSLNQEIFVSLAGVFTNFFFAGVFLIIYKCNPSFFLLYNAGVHLVLGLFNLCPVGALDGGRALYYFICIFSEQDKAERIMKIISVITAAVLFAAGAVLFIKTKNISLLITAGYLILIGGSEICVKGSRGGGGLRPYYKM